MSATGKETQKFCTRSIVGPGPSVYGRFGLLALSGSLNVVRIRCNLPAATPHVGFEPIAAVSIGPTNY